MNRQRFGLLLGALGTLLYSLPQYAHAHVGYVLSDAVRATNNGTDWAFLTEPLQHSSSLSLILGTVIVAALAYYVVSRSRYFIVHVRNAIARGVTYDIFAPWILRLAIGIALIGAATSQTLISPIITNADAFGFAQLFIGFLLLAGLLVGPAAIAALALYGIGLTHTPYLVGNIEFAAAALVILLWQNSRPGIDDVLGCRFLPTFTPLSTAQGVAILRIGMGVAMGYLAVYEKFLNPHLSADVVTAFHLTNIIPVSVSLWVLGAGIVELAIAIALIVGFRTRAVASIAFIVLSLSFFYFGEQVASHITLFAILSLLISLGSGSLRTRT